MRQRTGLIPLGIVSACLMGCHADIIFLPCQTANDCGPTAVCVAGVCEGQCSSTDPCTLLRFGEGAEADVSGVTSDTFIEEVEPTWNWGSSSLLHTDGSSGGRRVALLRFDLSSLSPQTPVVGTTLVLTSWQTNPSNDVHTVHRVLEGWVEGQESGVNGAANWTMRSDSQAWSSAGCGEPDSRAAEVLAQFVPSEESQPQAIFLQLPVAAIQQWIDEPASNHGLAIVLAGNDGGTIRSRENADDYRPRLDIQMR